MHSYSNYGCILIIITPANINTGKKEDFFAAIAARNRFQRSYLNLA